MSGRCPSFAELSWHSACDEASARRLHEAGVGTLCLTLPLVAQRPPTGSRVDDQRKRAFNARIGVSK